MRHIYNNQKYLQYPSINIKIFLQLLQQGSKMSHLFFDYQTLKTGSICMLQTIMRCYTEMGTKKVSPDVQPGFLRNQLDENPPEKGKDIREVIKSTQQKIHPGIMLWQSPKYFGYFPSNMAVTNVIAQMYTSAVHSPGFNYAVSPTHTELQNIQMDWSAKALGLPDCFLLNNSGGGIINHSLTQSVLITVHAAKRKKMMELSINQIDPRILKFVGYNCEIAHNGGQKGLLMKQIYYRRSVRANFNKQKKNYEMDIKHFQELLLKDLEEGLIPFWFGSTYGSTLSGAIDFSQQLVQLCKKHKIWLNIDAAYLGSTWICEQFRPKRQLLQSVDSICINFSKVLLLGTGGSLMFLKDKQQLNRAFGGTAKFSFYQNKYTGRNDVVDYKDWMFGLSRRNNSIKLYFLYEHYGLQNLRKLIRQNEQKAVQFEKHINQDSQIFQIFCRQYAIVCFKVKTKDGVINEELTQKVIERTKNIFQGFSSPGHFKGNCIIRIVIGNYNSDMKTILAYYEKIKQIAKQQRQKFAL